MINPANVKAERIARYKDCPDKFDVLVLIVLLILCGTTIFTTEACVRW
jgi:hypothetical protein